MTQYATDKEDNPGPDQEQQHAAYWRVPHGPRAFFCPHAPENDRHILQA